MESKPPPAPTARWTVYILVALGLGLLAWYDWRGMTHFAGPNYDDVVYLVMGKALATGHGYRMIGQPDAPFQVAYPPVYPGLLALVWALFPAWPANLLAFKALNILAAVASTLGIYRLVTKVYGASRLTGLLSAVLTALSMGLSALMDLTMSELVFMALVVAALNVLEPTFEATLGAECALEASPATAGRGLPVRKLVGAGLLVALVMLTKALGVTLAASALLWLLWQRRWRAMLWFGGAVALGNAPWQLWVRILKHSSLPVTWDYMAWVQEHTGGFNPLSLIANLKDNVPEALEVTFPFMLANVTSSETVLRWLTPLHLAGAFNALGYGAIGLVAAGLVVTARRRLRVWQLYVVCFLMLALAFPWEPTRYTITLMPLFAYAFVEGCWVLARHVPPRAFGRGLAAMALAIGLVGGFWRFGSVMRPFHPVHDALLPAYQAAQLADREAFVPWAQAHLPPDALIVHDRDPLAYLDTGRTATNYFDGLKPGQRAKALFTAHPSFLVVMPHQTEYLTTHAALRSLLGPARPVFQSPSGGLEVYALPRHWD